MADESDIGGIIASTVLWRLTVMLSVGGIILIYVFGLGRLAGKPRPRCVAVLGFLLILGSVYKLWGFLSYDYYLFMFQQLPGHIIFVRYCFSVTLRILNIIAATGLLLMKESFRRLVILLALYTLCTLYWKHPYYVFENISRNTEHIFLHKTAGDALTYPWHPWVSLTFNYFIDVVFSGSLLYCLTRPKIKIQFNQNEPKV